MKKLSFALVALVSLVTCVTPMAAAPGPYLDMFAKVSPGYFMFAAATSSCPTPGGCPYAIDNAGAWASLHVDASGNLLAAPAGAGVAPGNSCPSMGGCPWVIDPSGNWVHLNVDASGNLLVSLAAGGGTGDFSGPASSVNNNLVSFNGTGGKTGKDSGIAAANVLQSGGALGTPSSATLTNATGLPITGITSSTSAQLRTLLSDESGTGVDYFQGGDLGTPSAGVLTNATGLPIAGITGLGTGIATWWATPTSANLAAALTNETGSGAAVFGTSPTLNGATLSGATTVTGQGEATAASSAINTSETILVQSGGGTSGAALAANRIVAGTRIRVTLIGTCTASAANASHFRIRIGTAGTTSDTAAYDMATSNSATSGNNIPFRVVMDMVVRAPGASATSYGEYTIINQGVTGLSTANATTAIPTMTAFDTTAADFITVTYVSAVNTTTSTFQTASLEFPNN